MSTCDAELCPHWTGHGCICEVLDIDRPTRCQSCGCPDDAPQFGGGCGVCGYECEGWR